MGLISAIRKWWRGLFSKKDIEAALNLKIAITPEQQRKYELWRQLYNGEAIWNTDPENGVPSLHIAAGACSETAIAVTVKLESEVTGDNPRSKFLDYQYKRVIGDLRETIEKCCAGSVVILKPFVRYGEIMVTVSENNCFYPLKYNELGELVSVIFADTLTENIDQKTYYYTLLEKCTFENNTYRIEYSIWKSENMNALGKQISFAEGPDEWKELPEYVQWPDVEHPWFAVLQMPGRGEALFSRGIDLIREGDKQFGRAIWEFEGGELAIDVGSDLMKKDSNGNFIIPQGRNRLFRAWEGSTVPGEIGITEYNPEFRDVSIFNGLNEFLRRIEFVLGLAYGILSNPQDTDKTATEIKNSKQRFYQTVSDIQRAAQLSLETLVVVMDDIATRYNLAPFGEYDISFFWDDSILKTTEEKRAEYYEELKWLIALKGSDIIDKAEIRAFVIENSDFFSKITPEMIKEAQAGLPEVLEFDE